MRPRMFALTGLAAFAAAANAAPRPPAVSWGKAGVAYDQYRRDSVDCGIAGATRDMSGQQAYKEAMHGIQVQNSIIDNNDGPTGDTLRDYSLVQRRTMQRQVPTLQRHLVGGVERCLIGKGYAPFTLTKGQARALAKLPRGTEKRFRYLHGLASDRSVLAAQGMAIEPAPAPTPTPTPAEAR